jgi:phosphomannomutase
VVRVMVEAATADEASAVAERLADVVRRRLTL